LGGRSIERLLHGHCPTTYDEVASLSGLNKSAIARVKHIAGWKKQRSTVLASIIEKSKNFPLRNFKQTGPEPDWRGTSNSRCGFRNRRLAVDVVGKLSYRTTCFGFVSTKPERRDAHQKSIFATRGPYSITATASRLTSV
jgi:hypothetical protein